LQQTLPVFSTKVPLLLIALQRLIDWILKLHFLKILSGQMPVTTTVNLITKSTIIINNGIETMN